MRGVQSGRLLGATILAAMALALALVVPGCEESSPELGSSLPITTTTTLDKGLAYDLAVSVPWPSAASLYQTHLAPWMEAVEAASGGRVTFTVYAENTLVDEEEQYEAMLEGISDISLISADVEPGVCPFCELAGLPMLFPNVEVAAQAMLTLLEEFGEGDGLEGARVLGVMFLPPSQWSGKAPMRGPADLRGLRVGIGGETEAQTIEALGGTPVEVSIGGLSLRQSEDLLDGVLAGWPDQVWSVAAWPTHYTECNLFMPMEVLVMNEDKWDILPSVVRQAFGDSSGTGDWLGYLAAEQAYQLDNSAVPDLPQEGRDRKAIETRADSLGTQLIVLTPEERAQWQEALEPVYRDWVEEYADSLPTQDILDRVGELVDEYSVD